MLQLAPDKLTVAVSDPIQVLSLVVLVVLPLEYSIAMIHSTLELPTVHAGLLAFVYAVALVQSISEIPSVGVPVVECQGAVAMELVVLESTLVCVLFRSEYAL